MSARKTTPKKRRAGDSSAPTQTERLIRLEEGLKAVDQGHAHHMSALNGTLKTIQTDIRALGDRVSETQWGSDGKPGTLIKLDRLEQSMAQARVVVRMLGGTVITLVVGAAWAALSGGL